MDLGVNPFDVLTVVDYGDAEVVPADQRRSHEAIRRAVGEICAAGAVPIVLGGDHSIAHPDVGAVAWLLLGRPQREYVPADTKRRRRVLGPEDAPDFEERIRRAMGRDDPS